MASRELDIEERRRRQAIKVILTEILMFLTVVVIVVVATLIAMGFSVGKGGSIEQTGILQLHSLPTGATVELDGNVLFPRTNLSRSLSEGLHQLKLSRDGYDTWERGVRAYPGILSRLYYPRLFLKERQSEKMLDLAEAMEFYTVAPSGAYILYSREDSTKWNLVDLRGDEPRLSELDLTEVLPDVKDDKFTGSISDPKWSDDGRRVLVKVGLVERAEWILIDLKDTRESLNLTKTFGMDFSRVEIADGSADQLWALENQHLRKVSTTAQAVSRVLLDKVTDFAFEKTNVIYLTAPVVQSVPIRVDDGRIEFLNTSRAIKQIGLYRDGEKGGSVLDYVIDDQPVFLAITDYYGAKYFTYIVNNRVTIRYGEMPMYSPEGMNHDKLSTLLDRVDLGIAVKSFSTSPSGEFLVAMNQQNFTTIDIDMGEMFKYQASTDEIGWLSDGMIYGIQDGRLLVWDFDGSNRRDLTKVTNYPVAITGNGRYLYYVLANKNGGLELRRERILN